MSVDANAAWNLRLISRRRGAMMRTTALNELFIERAGSKVMRIVRGV
jgi:hypothetical protein